MYEVWYNRGMKTVGHLTPKVIKAFDLDYKPGEEITLSAPVSYTHLTLPTTSRV